MNTLKDFYIYGRPIETKIGKLHFITVGEYYDFIKEGHMNCLILTKEDLINSLKQIEQLDNNIKTIIYILSEVGLFEFIKQLQQHDIDSKRKDSYFHILGLCDLYIKFKNMFEFCFKEDVFDKISTSEEFEAYRDLIMEINCFPNEKPNPNPEIEKYNQMRRFLQQQKGEGITFEAMYTSVGLAFGKDPDEMTLYKFNKYFNRLAQFKSYDTTTLFATVSSDVKIESWYKTIEEKKNDLQTITEEELKSKTQQK